MKTSTKALLAAIVVFPGMGHVILKRQKTAAALIVIAIIALIIVLAFIVETAWRIVNGVLSSGTAPDFQTLNAEVNQALLNSESFFINGSLLVLLFVWIISIVDVWRLCRNSTKG